MFGWLFRKRLPVADQLTAGYTRLRELFGRRFPGGEFSSCDMRPHFDGYLHNAWAEVLPVGSVEATRTLAYARLAEMVEFFRSHHTHFGPHDWLQFGVGFPIAVKPTGRRILKGWVPASRLGEVQSPDFAAVGGAIGGNDLWFQGLWPSVGGPASEQVS
ncbi:MAG: hypothetical protein K2X82_25400 [Gemmataceae bacterium]|nr:hypothetical protein [Gemmataceae bacterium]